MDRLYTIGESADLLRVSKPTMYRLMKDGKVRPVKIGGRTLFKESELDRFINSLKPHGAVRK